jgi:8-oxo-dGTP pyrophosphatase MutT (NUDIX family)
MNKLDIDKLKSVLPLTPGILHKEQYFKAAVLIPFVKEGDEYHLLFEKRAANIRQGSEICFPGGEFDEEKDINFEQTALRETAEELGISLNSITVIGRLDTLIGPMGILIEPYIGILELNSRDKLNIDEFEVEKAFKVPISYFTENEPEIYHLRMEIHPTITEKDGTIVEIFPAKTLNLPERYWIPWKGPKREVYVYKTEEGVIWGLTAELIRELVRKLKEAG